MAVWNEERQRWEFPEERKPDPPRSRGDALHARRVKVAQMTEVMSNLEASRVLGCHEKTVRNDLKAIAADPEAFTSDRPYVACKMPDCNRPPRSLGLCRMHYDKRRQTKAQMGW